MLEGEKQQGVLEVLEEATKQDTEELRDAETRQKAVEAFAKIIDTIGNSLSSEKVFFLVVRFQWLTQCQCYKLAYSHFGSIV